MSGSFFDDGWKAGYDAGCAAAHDIGCSAVEGERDALREQVATLTAERDDARDRAFRAAFALEDGARVMWGALLPGDGYPTPCESEAQARRVALWDGPDASPIVVMSRVVGPWKPVRP